MVPVRINLEGFMSYRHRQTLDFEGQALWVLAGPNGAGKSAVFDAMTFALYGRYRGGEQQHATRLINHSADLLRIEFEFRVGSRTYQVLRTCPKKGASIWEAFEWVDGAWSRIEGADRVSECEAWTTRTLGLGYEAFVSSVMLVQGQSERLLKANPSERYDVLAELIDLRPYQVLEDRAQRLQKRHETHLDLLEGSLRAVPETSEEELAAAQSRTVASQEAYDRADQEVERWVKIWEGAKRYAKLQKDREVHAAQLDRDRELLARASEVQAGLDRHQELSGVLEPLRKLAGLRQKQDQEAARQRKLEPEVQKLAESERVATVQREQLDAALQDLEHQKAGCQQQLREIEDQLTAKGPLAEALKHIEETEEELRQLVEQAAEFPSDLKEQLTTLQQEFAASEEARLAQSILRRVFAQRKELIDAEDEAARARQAAEAACLDMERRRAQLDQILGEQRAAQEQVNHLERELTELAVSSRECTRRRAQFEAAADDHRCGLCGQAIDERHATDERERLARQIAGIEQALEVKRQARREAVDKEQRLAQQLGELQGMDIEAQKLCERLAATEQECTKQIARGLKSLATACSELPEAFRLLVGVGIAATSVSWRQTSYPKEEDLRALAERAAEQPAQVQRMRELSQQLETFSALSGQITRAQAALMRLAKNHSRAELIAAREDQQELLAERERKRVIYDNLGENHATMSRQLREVLEGIDSTSKLRHGQERELSELRVRATDREEQLGQLIQQLPSSWAAQATGPIEDALQQLIAEHTRLSSFEAEAKELASAQQRQAAIQGQIQALSQQLDATPQEERSSPAAVEEALMAARLRRNEGDVARQEALSEMRELATNQAKRLELEEKKRQAERQHHLCKRLAKLLGREELQRYVMRSAEREIVRLANQTLSGLSRGRMQLSLRHDETIPNPTTPGKHKERQRALDLLFHNADTSQQPMDIRLASGSQGFRVAISLALAMGRYFGQDIRRVESVIIDEGFGCLDKPSREDTIEALNSLQETLQRIILVSHQDEFAHEFRNGYAIRLEERASIATRIGE